MPDRAAPPALARAAAAARRVVRGRRRRAVAAARVRQAQAGRRVLPVLRADPARQVSAARRVARRARRAATAARRVAAGGRRRRRGRRGGQPAPQVASPGAAGAAGTGGATLPANVILESMTTSTTATSFSARLTNTGPTTPLISAIKIRYYFIDDSGDHTAIPTITSASWKITSPPTTINLASTGGGCSTLTTFTSTPTRNSYVDFGCALTSPLGVGDTITIAMTIDPAAQIPTNDYSYLPPVSVSQFVANDHMLAMVNGVVVAGTPPP